MTRRPLPITISLSSTALAALALLSVADGKPLSAVIERLVIEAMTRELERK